MVSFTYGPWNITMVNYQCQSVFRCSITMITFKNLSDFTWSIFDVIKKSRLGKLEWSAVGIIQNRLGGISDNITEFSTPKCTADSIIFRSCLRRVIFMCHYDLWQHIRKLQGQCTLSLQYIDQYDLLWSMDQQDSCGHEHCWHCSQLPLCVCVCVCVFVCVYTAVNFLCVCVCLHCS